MPAAPTSDVPAETSTQPVLFSARNADALALVAEGYLAHGAMEVRGADRYQIVLHQLARIQASSYVVAIRLVMPRT
jgi:hypothetical protein